MRKPENIVHRALATSWVQITKIFAPRTGVFRAVEYESENLMPFNCDLPRNQDDFRNRSKCDMRADGQEKVPPGQARSRAGLEPFGEPVARLPEYDTILPRMKGLNMGAVETVATMVTAAIGGFIGAAIYRMIRRKR
jgi:hypothetical protein